MCWNAEVSLNTFIYAFISSLIVIGFNRIPIIYVIIGKRTVALFLYILL